MILSSGPSVATLIYGTTEMTFPMATCLYMIFGQEQAEQHAKLDAQSDMATCLYSSVLSVVFVCFLLSLLYVQTFGVYFQILGYICIDG
jgi:hypothetical protein